MRNGFDGRMARIARALVRNVLAAEAETVAQARRAAVRLSSGTHTQAELTRAGHPYAARAPQSAYDPTVVNAGTGVFRRAWVAVPPRRSLGGVVSRLYNADPKARFMTGTRRMVSRDMRWRVVRAVAPGRWRRLREAVSRARRA